MTSLARLVFFLSLLHTPAVIAQTTPEKPNVLLFLVDDMGLMDTSVPFLVDENGRPKTHPPNDFYRTPNIERLARLGTRLSQFYANSVCSPSRTSLMNGQFSARHHTTQFISPDKKNTGAFGPAEWKWEGFSDGDTTLPAQLKASGYRTIHAGKAHFGPVGKSAANPLNLGFDVNIAGCAYGQPGSYLGTKNYGNGIKNRQKRAVPGLQKYHGTETHLTEAITNEMKAAITDAVEEDKPFFAYMSHYAVHSPFEPDSRFVDNYRDGNSAKLAAFASLIEGMDKSLGDLLTHLKSLGVAQNTLVIFLGDNGTDAPIGNAHEISCAAPLRGKKGTHYEGGMRVPFIAAWAKPDTTNQFQSQYPVTPNRIITRGFGNICDVYATIIDLTGTASRSDHIVDGVSLLASLGGRPLPEQRDFLMHFPHAHRSSYFTAFRRGNHKLVYHYPVNRNGEGDTMAAHTELFDLAADPTETTNLADTNPFLKNRMIAAMSASLKSTGAQYAVDQDDPLKPQFETEK